MAGWSRWGENVRPPVPRGLRRPTRCSCLGRRVERVADVLEDARDDRTQEEQRDDHDDRQEGEKQAVLHEGLAVLVFTLEANEKSADEVLDHWMGYLLSEEDCV